MDFIFRKTIKLHVANVLLRVVLLPGDLTSKLIFKLTVSVRTPLFTLMASSNIARAREMTITYQLHITFDICITNQAKGVLHKLMLELNMLLFIIKKM
jgi:hypothetical protein